MLARQPSHMSARRRHASMSAVSSSRSVCQHQRACTFAYRHVSMLARQQTVSRSPCLEICISLCHNVSISVSSRCLNQCICKHTNLSACQNVSKSECLQACISPCQRLSASGSKRFSKSVSAYQRVNMWKRRHVRLWAFYQCEHVIEPLSRHVSMSACQHVSVLNYNMTSEKTFPKNPEDYNCIVATVLNVLHPFWSCILFSFCASFESSSKFLRGQIVSLVGFFKVQVKLQWKQKWNIVWPGSMKPDLVM